MKLCLGMNGDLRKGTFCTSMIPVLNNNVIHNDLQLYISCKYQPELRVLVRQESVAAIVHQWARHLHYVLVHRAGT
jgi:hypothetical protein